MYKILMFSLLFVLAGCSIEGNRSVDREKIKQEMSDRQIKRVSESVLMDAAFQTGRKLVSKTENVLLKKLRNFPETIPLDSVIDQAAFPGYDKLIVALLDSLNRKSGHRVGLIGLNLKNIHPDTSAIEKQLLDAYQYNMERNMPLDDNVQKSGKDYLLFTSAITSGMDICLLASAANAGSNQIYKSDTHRVDFCGMWCVELSKKDLIKSL